MSTKRSGLRKSLVLVGVLALVVPLLSALAAPVSAATLCVNTGGTDGCYGSIQAAVNDASGGDVIHVYPGTYDESVNLSVMEPDGDLTLMTVNTGGVPTPGTVQVHYSGPQAEIRTETAFDGNLIIDGFVVYSDASGVDVEVESPEDVDSSLVIRNVTATGTGDNGIEAEADGNVTITNCQANDNTGAGGNGIIVRDTDGDVVILNCEASGNGSRGIWVSKRYGSTVTIKNCTANGNGGDGFFVEAPAYVVQAVNGGGGNVTITNCMAVGNGESGFDAQYILGQLSIQACIARDNDEGVDLSDMDGVEAMAVNGSIICGNDCGVFLEEPDVLQGGAAITNLVGNWWGCGEGPDDPACDSICKAGIVGGDFAPWISKVSASATVDPVSVGEPTVVGFQFSANPAAVYLGQGPGDLRGPGPFTVSTDNGTLNGNGASVKEFINAPNGTLEVNLVPDTVGTATVTVSGPCGLANLEGATAVLGVVAAQGFVPEPGSVLLLGSGLAGLAAYATLRLRKR